MVLVTSEQYRNSPRRHGPGDETEVRSGRRKHAFASVSSVTPRHFGVLVLLLEPTAPHGADGQSGGNGEVLLCRQRETHSASCAALQCPVHRACITNEICAGLRIPREELVRQHVSLHSIARRTGADEVSRRVRAAARYRMDVVQRRFHRVEPVPAVDTTSAAVAHCRALELSFVVPIEPGRMREESAAVPHTPS